MTFMSSMMLVNPNGPLGRRVYFLDAGNPSAVADSVEVSGGGRFVLFLAWDARAAADETIVDDISEVFNYLTGYSNQRSFREMLVAPVSLRTELKALVGVLGFSRTPAFRFATDKTRSTSLRLATAVLADLGGSPKEVLTDRDPAFVVGQTSDGRAIFAPQWVDLALRLGTTAKACRPYRAKTKGKVERVIREIKEDFLPWLSGQALPPRPTIAIGGIVKATLGTPR